MPPSMTYTSPFSPILTKINELKNISNQRLIPHSIGKTISPPSCHNTLLSQRNSESRPLNGLQDSSINGIWPSLPFSECFMDTLATGGLSQKYGVNWLAMKPPQLSTVIEFCMTPEGAQNVHHIPLMLIWRTWWTGVALIKLEIDGIPDCGWDAASRLGYGLFVTG
ncbi:hypothetical protein CPB84DRAFT_1853778 [Gymnopilus junonius]|uniref:Uncharacterized protein n=1 Tax=Gymnopilus junonius TaxID=109634 RepID=A0A9P5NAJ0_GYMJU|nr:hypothetical protein CPB84DRAFT_1853778 [Gymnopilus junonius]